MQIRLATQSDLIKIAVLDAQASLTPWSYDNYSSSFNNPKHKISVLSNANPQDIIGAVVIAQASDEAEVLQLWIKADLQRHSHGKFLLKDVLDRLQHRGINQVFLEVREDNASAIGLYRNLGFMEVGKRTNYYKVESWYFDALIMLKQLNQPV